MIYQKRARCGIDFRNSEDFIPGLQFASCIGGGGIMAAGSSLIFTLTTAESSESLSAQSVALKWNTMLAG